VAMALGRGRHAMRIEFTEARQKLIGISLEGSAA
jgi:hypothetical protein